VLHWLGRKKQVDGLVGLSINEGRFALAHITRRRDDVYLESCRRQVIGSPADTAALLADAVSAAGLSGAACNLVLSPREYNIYMVEAPQVEPAEVSSAVRWKIKDLLDMPLEEAVLDVIPLPDDAFRGRGRMVYVAVASRSAIDRNIALVESCGLNLQSIDIPELAMRNISLQFGDDHNGLAFLALKESGSTLNITRGRQLYLTRKINTHIGADAMNAPDWDMVRDRLALEIQRSLDYFESQMGQSPVSQILIAPRLQDTESMMNSLGEALASPVGVLDFTIELDSPEAVTPAVKGSAMMAIGAALRTDALEGSA
jgi:MSHA biogenesis protein MshI